MTTENKALLIISAIPNPENTEALQTYLSRVYPVMAKNGGKPVGKYQTAEHLMGDQGPERIILMEFPGTEAIKEMVSGNDFEALAKIRAEAFTKINLMISSEM